MARYAPVPAYDVIADPVTGKGSRSYLEFFDGLYNGDPGTSWIPTFTNLTTVGTPSITGIYYRVGRLCYFHVNIIPATSTSSTSGSTYINNFPLTIRNFSAVTAVTNAPSAAQSMADSTNNRIYTPTWSAVTSQVTITGFIEAS